MIPPVFSIFYYAASCRSVQRATRLFPVAAVEGLDADLEAGRIVQRVDIDAPGVRMRSRLVEALHAARRAEQMLRAAGPKAVVGQRVLTLEQPEIPVRHDQVPKARPAADRAVALEHGHFSGYV